MGEIACEEHVPTTEELNQVKTNDEREYETY